MSPSVPKGVCQMLYLSPLLAVEVFAVEGSRRRKVSTSFFVKSEAGVKRKDESGSEEMGMSGRALIIAITSAIKVDKTS